MWQKRFIDLKDGQLYRYVLNMNSQNFEKLNTSLA
jgi:hypothetical protein